METLIQLDHRLFFLINNGMGTKSLDSIFGDLSALGGWTVVLLALALLGNAGKRVLWRHIAVLTVAMMIFSPVTGIMKKSIGRSRPLKCFREQIEAGTVNVRVLGEPLKRKSFPSGHSMLAFFSMTYVALFRKGVRYWVLVLAGLIAFSRIYVGAHFPLDCIAGSLIGVLGAFCAHAGYNRVFKPEEGCLPS